MENIISIDPCKNKSKTSKMIPYDLLKEQFENRGYILLSDESECINNTVKLRYLCKKHIDKGELLIDYHHFKMNRGCYYCGRERTEQGHLIELDPSEDKKLCEKHGFKYFDTVRINGKICIRFYCKKHKELGIQIMPKANMKRDLKGCQYCASKNLPDWYVKEMLHKKLPLLNMVTKYKGMNQYAWFYCTKHHTSFKTTPRNVFTGHKNCPHCAKEAYHAKQVLSEEEITERIFKSNPYLKINDFNDYQNSEDKITVSCVFCSNSWKSPIASLIVNGTRCPFCQVMTKGERAVNYYLESNQIKHIPQYRINECKDKRAMPFDNSVLSQQGELLGLIEFYGEQHYHPVSYFGGEPKYKQTVRRDKIKQKYCSDNNIPLLIIPYWDMDNVPQLMEDFCLGLVKNFT